MHSVLHKISSYRSLSCEGYIPYEGYMSDESYVVPAILWWSLCVEFCDKIKIFVIRFYWKIKMEEKIDA